MATIILITIDFQTFLCVLRLLSIRFKNTLIWIRTLKKPPYYHDPSLGRYLNFRSDALWSCSKTRNAEFRAEQQCWDRNSVPEWPLPALWRCHFWPPNLQHCCSAEFYSAAGLERGKENAWDIPLQHHLAFHRPAVLLVWKRAEAREKEKKQNKKNHTPKQNQTCPKIRNIMKSCHWHNCRHSVNWYIFQCLSNSYTTWNLQYLLISKHCQHQKTLFHILIRHNLIFYSY